MMVTAFVLPAESIIPPNLSDSKLATVVIAEKLPVTRPGLKLLGPTLPRKLRLKVSEEGMLIR